MALCDVVDCRRPIHGGGLCAGHRAQLARGKELSPLRTTAPPQCRFPGCNRPSANRKRRLCHGHQIQRARGRRLAGIQPASDLRPLVPHPSIKEALLVPLTRGLFATVDQCDGARVGRFHWSVVAPARSKTKYAVSRSAGPDGKAIRLHLFLWRAWGCAPAKELDHINTDGLDCRRENLRPSTAQQNCANRSVRRTSSTGYKGVFRRGTSSWAASIYVGGRRKHLGTFASPVEAAAAYADAARALHGDFAWVDHRLTPAPR